MRPKRCTSVFCLHLCLLLIGLLGACSAHTDRSNAKGAENTEPQASARIGSKGGTLTLLEGPARGAQIIIPPGALTSPVTITLRAGLLNSGLPAGTSGNKASLGTGGDLKSVSLGLPGSQIPLGPTVVWGPEGQKFQRPVTVVVPTREPGTKLYTAPLNVDKWTEINGAHYDPARKAMVGETTHFSRGIGTKDDAYWVLRRSIEDVYTVPANQYKYQVKDDQQLSMDAAKIIANPGNADEPYIAVYQSNMLGKFWKTKMPDLPAKDYVDDQYYKVPSIATSKDLFTWTNRGYLSKPGWAADPTIRAYKAEGATDTKFAVAMLVDKPYMQEIHSRIQITVYNSFNDLVTQGANAPVTAEVSDIQTTYNFYFADPTTHSGNPNIFCGAQTPTIYDFNCDQNNVCSLRVAFSALTYNNAAQAFLNITSCTDNASMGEKAFEFSVQGGMIYATKERFYINDNVDKIDIHDSKTDYKNRAQHVDGSLYFMNDYFDIGETLIVTTLKAKTTIPDFGDDIFMATLKHTFIYDYGANSAEPILLNTHGGSLDYGAPSIELIKVNRMMPNGMAAPQDALVMSTFIVENYDGFPKEEVGELIYYRFLEDQLVTQ